MNTALNITTDEIISTAMEIGRQLLISGAEIHRVEDSMLRICLAYGATDCQVYAVPSNLLVTAARAGEKPITRMLRIYERGTNLRKLDDLNSLCRELCTEPIATQEVHRRLEAINAKKDYSPRTQCIAAGGAAGFFALIFSHNISTGLISFCTGVLMRYVLNYFARFHINRIFENALGGFIIGAMAYIAAALDFTPGYSGVVIGGIMPLIPGLTFTNSMRDIITGDSVAGLTRFVEALLISTSIAVGVAIPLSIGRMIIGG